MDRSDIDKLLATAKEERDRYVAAIDAEYKKKIAALKVVLGMLPTSQKDLENTTNPAAPTVTMELAEQVGASVHSPLTEYGVVARAIRAAFQENPLNFTAASIAKAVAERNPSLKVDRVTVSKALIRMARLGEIEIVSEGSGRRPSVYRLKNHSGGEKGVSAA